MLNILNLSRVTDVINSADSWHRATQVSSVAWIFLLMAPTCVPILGTTSYCTVSITCPVPQDQLWEYELMAVFIGISLEVWVSEGLWRCDYLEVSGGVSIWTSLEVEYLDVSGSVSIWTSLEVWVSEGLWRCEYLDVSGGVSIWKSLEVEYLEVSIRPCLVNSRTGHCRQGVSISILTPVFLPSPSVSLSIYILAVPICKCWGELLLMSYPFSVACWVGPAVLLQAK